MGTDMKISSNVLPPKGLKSTKVSTQTGKESGKVKILAEFFQTSIISWAKSKNYITAINKNNDHHNVHKHQSVVSERKISSRSVSKPQSNTAKSKTTYVFGKSMFNAQENKKVSGENKINTTASS